MEHSTEVYAPGPARFNMVGQKLPTQMHLTEEKSARASPRACFATQSNLSTRRAFWRRLRAGKSRLELTTPTSARLIVSTG